MKDPAFSKDNNRIVPIDPMPHRSHIRPKTTLVLALWTLLVLGTLASLSIAENQQQLHQLFFGLIWVLGTAGCQATSEIDPLATRRIDPPVVIGL